MARRSLVLMAACYRDPISGTGNNQSNWSWLGFDAHVAAPVHYLGLPARTEPLTADEAFEREESLRLAQPPERRPDGTEIQRRRRRRRDWS